MYWTVGPILRQYIAVVVLNFSVLCFGIGIAWTSPVLVKLRNETDPVLYRPITEEEGSWIVAIGFLFSLPVSFITGYLADKIGRKYCVILGTIPRLASCLLFIFANDVWMLLVGRTLIAAADIMAFNCVPMYASEIASKELRGSLGTILQISSCLGIVIMLSIGPFISYLSLNIMFLAVVLVTSIPQWFLPDSPYYLYSKGRIEESKNLLISLRGSEIAANEELKEYSLLKNDVKIPKRDLFKNRTFIKALILTCIISIGTQMVGFNAVSFYLQTVLESTQTSSIVSPEVASAICGTIQLIASFCATVMTDRFGRKPIYVCTLVGMAVGMLGLGVFFKLKESNDDISGILNIMPLVSLILVIFGYSSGTGSLLWIVTSELFDGPSRAVGVSINGFSSGFFIFLTTKYFASVTLAIGAAATYWMFSINCVLFCLFIIFFVPETKDKSFGEIQEAIRGGKDIASNSL